MTTNVGTNHSFQPLQMIPLEEGQRLNVQTGSMHACKGVDVTSKLNGSIWNAVKMVFLGGEGFFINTYTSQEKNAWLALEEGHRGQVASYKLRPSEKLIMQRGAFVAADTNVSVSPGFAGVSTWFKGLGLWKLKASLKEGSEGRIFFDTKYGIVKEIKIAKEDGPVLIDNDHIIGFTDSLNFTWKKIGNVKTVLFSGEGFVNEVTGDGTVFVGTTTTKDDKENYVRKAVTGMINELTDGKSPAIVIATALAGLIYLSSRAEEARSGKEFEFRQFVSALYHVFTSPES